MIAEDLWTAEGPTTAELKVLERLGRRRQTIEAVTPADEGDAHVVARAHSTLDDMEECLCEEGAKAPALAKGWGVLDQLGARLTERPKAAAPARAVPDTRATDSSASAPEILPIRRQQPPPLPNEGTRRPPTQGDARLITTTSVETLRAVARRAAEDPQPPAVGGGNRLPSMIGLAARLATMVAGLLGAGSPVAGTLRIVSQALATFLPLLDFDPPTASPPAAAPEAKTGARIDLLRQERAARAYQWRQVAKQRARPDRPPAARGLLTFNPKAPASGVWNDLLDLTSEALETFVAVGDGSGAAECVDLLDLVSETIAENLPEAA